MKLDLKNQFVEELDNIYKTKLIYRTIVVCNDDIEEYKRLLENKDFSVYVVDVDAIATINYDALDHRVILIKHSLFEAFLNNIIRNNITDFYTYIAFTYDNETIKETIYKKYNNCSEIISNII
jgi:hypothetical protein|uniref:Uncharacterized protein n=1 Tax=viral metagenome TaxID=1070528 RepID=A0A6C0I9J9_9ZZZZ